MCRKGQTAQTHLCLLLRWQPLLGINVIKKVFWRILQSPGIQTLQAICQQPVILARNPAGWDSLKYLICWQNGAAVVLSPSERHRREAAPVYSIADEAMGYSFGEDGMEEKGCPFICVCERWTGPGSKGCLSHWPFTGSSVSEISSKEMFSSMILLSPGLHVHTYLGWRMLHCWWACLLWCLLFFSFRIL